MNHFAVIDTETNWADQVMSIGTVIANADNFRPLSMKYHLFPAECQIVGMYENVLFLETPVSPISCSRAEAMADIVHWLQEFEVTDIFAYNASFDRNHLPEFDVFHWHDIMRLAAYRQHNSMIPHCAECFSTGRLKRGYGVEAMLRLLSHDQTYRETHNALFDALDELQLMQLLGHPIIHYPDL